MTNDPSLRMRYDAAKNEIARLERELKVALDLVEALRDELSAPEDHPLVVAAGSWQAAMLRKFAHRAESTYGIRPHKELSAREVEQAKAAADAWLPAHRRDVPAALREPDASIVADTAAYRT